MAMKKIKTLGILLFITIILVNFTACSIASGEEEENGEIIVYTSVYPIYDFSQKIGGEKVQVELLMPPGAQPHGWEPSAKDRAKVEESQIFLYNGLGLDPWAERMAETLSNEEIQTLALAEIDTIKPMTFTEDHDHEEDENHSTYDPHVWLDPTNVEKMAEAIGNVFIEVDPANQKYYEENLKAFQKELQTLDEKFQQRLSSIKKRDFIVNHAAFGYLANRYDLNQIAITGLAPQAKPSPSKLKELTQVIREYDMHTIFMEELSSPKVVDVLAEETGVEVELLHPIGGLTQEEIDQGEDYLSLMRKNLENLSKALSSK